MNEHDGYISTELERTCAYEPIHLLGTVQAYGFLIVVERASARIVQVSTGITRHWPGLSDAAALLGAPLADWVDCASAIDGLGEPAPARLPCQLRLERTMAGADASGWECFGHRSGPFVLLEWLPRTAPDDQETLRQSRLLGSLAGVIARLRHAERLEPFVADCVQVMQELSGYDRVMIYRFMPEGDGEVVAEHTGNGVDAKFIGLRFPSTDIPSQARTLYLSNRLRVLADVDAAMDTLLPPTLPGGALLDQSHAILRGLSSVHLAYLRNMGVKATLTLSIVIDNRLWGLIACHHHQPRLPPDHVSEGLRQMYELVAEIANMRIQALSQLEEVRQRLSMDHLLNQFRQAVVEDAPITAVLDARLPELLASFHAHTLGLHIGNLHYVGGSGRRCGTDEQVLDEVRGRVDPHNRTQMAHAWSDLLTADNRRLHYLPEAAGLLLAQRYEGEMNFCFVARPEVVQQVRWGGEPARDLVTLPDGLVRLEPRRSFSEWKQSVAGKSQAWERACADALENLLQRLSELNKLQVNRSLQEKLRWRAHHDQLTGLYNRRAMEDEIAHRLEHGQFDAALMLLDMDHFKKINDTYGHEVGDRVLQQFSVRLKAVVRNFDLLGRLGGDEFLLLLRLPQPDAPTALQFALRLHEAVAAPFEINGQQLRLGISVGIAIPPYHGDSVSELLRHADLAMYEAKSLGRSRSVVFEAAMASDQLDTYLLERDLNEAVENNELSLVFQPKVDLVSRRVVGLEALVRWTHPSRGQSMPDAFIPIAERSDQIVRIDRWVMRAVVVAQAHWRAQGEAPLPVAINLSMADLLSTNLIGYLNDLLTEHHLPPAALEIEVTESCVMRELEQTKSGLQALNSLGISTTLDDFGTGFSSLSYLRQLPLQCLKIDQSFTKTMLLDANSEKLTQAILAMGNALKMSIVAEGVETEEQMRWLLAHGCHIGQGYFFSRPVVATDVMPMIGAIEARLAAQAGALFSH